jgi:predicted transcriptional regulator
VTLADQTEAYQALLEGHRAHPDDDEIAEDLRRARAAMEVAWLEHVAEAA